MRSPRLQHMMYSYQSSRIALIWGCSARDQGRCQFPHLAIIACNSQPKACGRYMGGGCNVSEQNSALPAALSIPRKATIEGAIEYSGPMIISGTIEGDVTCMSLVITERGVINGSVRSDSVTVLGEVNGEIYANTLTLKTASSVSGDIFHNHLVLEDGAYFEGKSRRMILPLELAL